ncbi:RNA polymerase Rpb4/RPC9 core domain-containing protein [Plasmodiophora brassicae]|uniref:RNA polymerase Rpb4/RPC9 core domain-containing protein n=1 Tax=Plasmodiophora brassicae TaxID=37360 RepID=A0A0G4J318_PLABS|nr:hypothetical protein PBRA_002235 [Plasmodiophora brassicae]SPQ98828.1 unnamed protein product [Plasmodiophora brassicae]
MAFRESRPPEDAATLELGPDFDRKRVRCLWNSEVAIILNHHINQKREAADADDSAEISPMIQQTLNYVQKFSNYKTKEAITSARELVKDVDAQGNPVSNRYADLDQFEIAAINNLNIQTVEEARTLIPSLNTLGKRIQARLDPSGEGRIPPEFDPDAVIESLLEDLHRYQNV